MWGSEFTSKDAALQGGDPAETAARLLVKMRVLVVVTARWYLTAYSTRNLKAATQKLKADEERVHSRAIRSCWFVLLFRTLPPAAPPASPVAPALAPARGMLGRVLYAAASFLL